MGERKVINKYYPPDFDPALIPRGTKPKNDQQTVRMMLPMSVRCKLCGEYLYRGKKFNAKKETVQGEEYLGIKIFRLYMKCTRCKGEFTIKTDPQNADYVAEHNVSRNFEPWRNTDEQVEEAKEKRRVEEEGDVMKQLENRTSDSKVELDILDALADIKSLNTRNAKLDLSTVIEERVREDRQKELDEEENLVQALFHNRRVKRLDEEDDEKGDEESMPGLLPVKASAEVKKEGIAEVKKEGVAEVKKETTTAATAATTKKRKAPFLPVIAVIKPKSDRTEKKIKPEVKSIVSYDEGEAGCGLLGLDY